MADLVERLEEVLLDDSRPKRTTRIGTLVSQPASPSSTHNISKENPGRVHLEP